MVIFAGLHLKYNTSMGVMEVVVLFRLFSIISQVASYPAATILNAHDIATCTLPAGTSSTLHICTCL